MSKKDALKLKGTVTKKFQGDKFKVVTEDGLEVMCTISGKIRMNKIKISENDVVDIEVSVYDLNTGRIVYRH